MNFISLFKKAMKQNNFRNKSKNKSILEYLHTTVTFACVVALNA